MSISNIPNNLSCVDKLISKIKTADKSNAKEVRITMQEAKDLVYELALVSSKLTTTLHSIDTKLDSITANNETIDLKFDGGDFKN